MPHRTRRYARGPIWFDSSERPGETGPGHPPVSQRLVGDVGGANPDRARRQAKDRPRVAVDPHLDAGETEPRAAALTDVPQAVPGPEERHWCVLVTHRDALRLPTIADERAGR